jgi:hypothetical protein
VYDLTRGVPWRRHLLKIISKSTYLPYNHGMPNGEPKWNPKMMATVIKRAKGKVMEENANEVSCTYP